MPCWLVSAKLSVCRRKMISSAVSTMALKMGSTASRATLWMASKGALQGSLPPQKANPYGAIGTSGYCIHVGAHVRELRTVLRQC